MRIAIASESLEGFFRVWEDHEEYERVLKDLMVPAKS